jgi:hypothetical protein
MAVQSDYCLNVATSPWARHWLTIDDGPFECLAQLATCMLKPNRRPILSPVEIGDRQSFQGECLGYLPHRTFSRNRWLSEGVGVTGQQFRNLFNVSWNVF